MRQNLKEGGREKEGWWRESGFLWHWSPRSRVPRPSQLTRAVGLPSLYTSAHWRALDFSGWGCEEVKKFFSVVGYCCFSMNLLTNLDNVFFSGAMGLRERGQVWYGMLSLSFIRRINWKKQLVNRKKNTKKRCLWQEYIKKRLKWQQIQ